MFAILLTLCLEVGLEALLEKLMKLIIDNLNSFKKIFPLEGRISFIENQSPQMVEPLNFSLPLLVSALPLHLASSDGT